MFLSTSRALPYRSDLPCPMDVRPILNNKIVISLLLPLHGIAYVFSNIYDPTHLLVHTNLKVHIFSPHLGANLINRILSIDVKELPCIRGLVTRKSVWHGALEQSPQRYVHRACMQNNLVVRTSQQHDLRSD